MSKKGKIKLRLVMNNQYKKIHQKNTLKIKKNMIIRKRNNGG